MALNILAFGIAKEILNKGALELPVDKRMRAGDLKALLEQQYPRLKELRSFMIAVNGVYATADTVIDPKDEVAIIPPVSGG